MTIEFKAWPKISRWENETYYITEKIDGTNACVVIDEEGDIAAQSRTRIITPENDNFGFALWVENNKKDLLLLGPGYHYGEWWGLGIQRGYGLMEKRFSLFEPWKSTQIPNCCNIVPMFNTHKVSDALEELLAYGSRASPGFMNIEGLVIVAKNTKATYKIIINKDR